VRYFNAFYTEGYRKLYPCIYGEILTRNLELLALSKDVMICSFGEKSKWKHHIAFSAYVISHLRDQTVERVSRPEYPFQRMHQYLLWLNVSVFRCDVSPLFASFLRALAGANRDYRSI